VESILKQGLDRQTLPEPHAEVKPALHYNIRGKEYYHEKEAGHA
jgi:hypothetical protein